MSYVIQTGSWWSSLVDGWAAYNGTSDYYMWERSAAGGFWDAYISSTISGFVEGVGDINGNVDVYYLFEILGDVQGVGYIFSSITVPEPIRIDGHCAGVGVIGSKFNFSRRKAWYPELRRDDTYSYNDAPIAAIQYVDFSPNKVLNVISYEDTFYENTSDFYLVETLSNNGLGFFPSVHYPYVSSAEGKINYLVTDFQVNGKPLFYQYELLFDSYSLEGSELVTIYKNNEIKIDPSQYIIQASYDLLSTGHTRYDSTTWKPVDKLRSIHRIRVLLPVEFFNKDDFFTVDYEKSVYGARTPQRELLELKPIYTQSVDYTVTSGVIIEVGSRIPDSISTIFMVKNPNDRIKPIGIEPPVYQPDKISSWRLRLNPGSLMTQSGLYNNSPEKFFSLSNKYAPDYYPITNVKPTYIAENILKVSQFPIFIDETLYTYPTYKIDLYDKKTLDLGEDKGKIAIEVNGVSRTDIKVLSIDRTKGFIQLSESLDQTDEIELDFYVDPINHLVIENLELNPKVRGGQEIFSITGYMNGLGIALKQYDPLDSYTDYLYIYDSSLPESNRVYTMIPPLDDINPPPSYSDGIFFPICEVNINRLSTDMVKVTDARRIGGGIYDTKQLDTWFINNSGLTVRNRDSYIGNAFYGGDPTSFGSMIVVHVPSGVLFSAKERWIASLSGVVADSIEAKERGTREFNYYLDHVIRKYISAGSDYMLIPIDSSGNFMDIVSLTYDYTV